MLGLRKLHRLLSWIVFAPLFVILLTGILIQYKNEIPYLQPEAIPSKNRTKALEQNWSIQSLFEIAKQKHPEHVKDIEDIRAIDIRPKMGTARLRTTNHYEIQIDLAGSTILKTEPRYVGWIISLHEGALFGSIVRFGFWAPIGILSLVLSITGFLILIRKRKNHYG
jgi:uncharacterized iron-regulated membrane protein